MRIIRAQAQPIVSARMWISEKFTGQKGGTECEGSRGGANSLPPVSLAERAATADASSTLRHHPPLSTTLSWISPRAPSTSGGFFTWHWNVPLSVGLNPQILMDASFLAALPSQVTLPEKRPLVGGKASPW